MTAPVPPYAFEASTFGDWLPAPIPYFVGNTATPDNFTGCSVVGALYQGPTLVLDMASVTGRTSLNNYPAQLNIQVAAADMVKLIPGDYRLVLGLLVPSGRIQPLLTWAGRIDNP